MRSLERSRDRLACHDRKLRDHHHRRRAGGSRDRLSPRAAGTGRSSSSRRTSASATTGASAIDSLRLYSPARYDGLPGLAACRCRVDVPDQGPDGRLPRGLRRALRAAGRHGRTRRQRAQGRRPLRRARRCAPLRGRQRRRGVGHVPGADRARPSRASSIRPSGSCTPPSTATRRSCSRAPCSSSAAATPAPTSPSRSRRRARRSCPVACTGEVPFDIEGRVARRGLARRCGSRPTTS